MNVTDAEKITADFGEFYANRRGYLAVLADGTTADNYVDIPYYSVWDLPHSPARIKYAILFKAEHAVKYGYMDFIPPGDEREKSVKTQPIGNVLHSGYGLLGDFVENAHEINKERLEIDSIQDVQKRKVAIIKFEAKHKINFSLPDQSELRVEFQNFLADLHNNWQ